MRRGESIPKAGAFLLGLLAAAAPVLASGQGERPAHHWPDESAYFRGLELMHRGVLFEAARLIEQHVAAHPDDVPATYDLGRVFFRLGRDHDALEALLSVLERAPDHTRAQRLLVRVRMRLGRNLDWSKPADVLEFARICTRLGNYDRARACYDHLLRERPTPALRMEYGQMLAWAGRYEEAILQFDALLEEVPGDADVLHQKGRALIALGRVEDAERILRDLVNRAPERTDARIDHARTLIWLTRDGEAEAQLRQVLTRDARDVEPRLLLAELFMERNRIEDAYAMYREILSIEPDHARALRAVGELERSPLLEIARLRRRVREDPRRTAERARLVDLLLDTGRPGEAIRELETWAAIADDATLREELQRLRARRRARTHAAVRERAAARDPATGLPPVRIAGWVDRHEDDGQARIRRDQALWRAGQASPDREGGPTEPDRRN